MTTTSIAQTYLGRWRLRLSATMIHLRRSFVRSVHIAPFCMRASHHTHAVAVYLPFQAVHTPYDLPPYCKHGATGKCKNVLWTMLQDADRYVGQLVATLKDKGMWDNTLLVYSADNGGVSNGINYPLRGEKHTNWQGGMAAASFVSGGVIPEKLRGTTNSHTFHVADW